jgi:ketosteroid isomerase-like protein
MDELTAKQLATLFDREALRELVAELASAVDRADRERVVACYADPSYDDHGSFKGSGEEFADFVCGPSPLTSMHHLLGQSVFDVQGDEAWGETFFVFHGAAGTAQVGGHGRYVDYFRRLDGSWKVVYRRVVPDVSPHGEDPDAYWLAHRDRGDPAYDHRRWPDDAPSSGP